MSVKTDLNSFYVITEALGGWRAAWAAATESVNLQRSGSPRTTTASAPTAAKLQQRGSGTACHPPHLRAPSTSAASVGRKGVSSGVENLEYHYSPLCGLHWVCSGNSNWSFPLSLFGSKLPEPGLGGAPRLLLSRATLTEGQHQIAQKELRQLHQRQQRYVFRVFSIAETCIVLSFKADTGGSSGALRRSVVTLSSLENARFQVDGLSVTGDHLTEKLRELQREQQPQLQQSLLLLTQVQRHHRLAALTLHDVARLVGHFYRQQLLSHLSKVLVSVDLLGRPSTNGVSVK